jgi:hypothetical protein
MVSRVARVARAARQAALAQLAARPLPRRRAAMWSPAPVPERMPPALQLVATPPAVRKHPRKAETQQQREAKQLAEWQRQMEALEERQRCPVTPGWDQSPSPWESVIRDLL